MLRRIAHHLAVAALLLSIAGGTFASATQWTAQRQPIAAMDRETEIVEYRVTAFTATEHGGSAPLGPGDEGPEESITF